MPLKTPLDMLNHELQDALVTMKTTDFKFKVGESSYALIGEMPEDPERCYVVDWYGSREGLIEDWRDHPKQGKKVARTYYAVRFRKTSKGFRAAEILLYGFWEE